MHSVPAERPLDPTTLEILQLLTATFATQSVAYFLIGATARDIIVQHVHGIPAGRATRDVDLAIALENWDQFDHIKNLLIATGKFFPSSSEAHRLHYVPYTGEPGFPLDLIPFGGIESNESQIAWPPDKAIVMNVAGYAEAMRTATEVEVEPGLSIKVVSIPGLAALKLLAWVDRHRSDTKDALDLYFLLKNYAAAGNMDRVYEDAIQLLEDCGHDPDLAGAALLGSDCRDAMGEEALRQLQTVLDDQRLRDRLVLHMGGRADEAATEALRYLGQFQRGLQGHGSSPGKKI